MVEQACWIKGEWVLERGSKERLKPSSLAAFSRLSGKPTLRTSPARLNSPKLTKALGRLLLLTADHKARAKGSSMETSLSFIPPATLT